MNNVRLLPRFRAQHKQYADRNGMPFALVRVIDKPDATHDVEVLPVYVIRFEDGVEVNAWPEEVEVEETI